MSNRKSNSSLSRRGLLKGATLAGAAVVGTPLTGRAQDAPRPAGPTTPAPNPAMEGGHSPDRPIIQSTSGSDYMADVIKSLGIEHVACNPGTSFRGLHESLINYLKIDWHTCTHEEASVAMAKGLPRSRASRSWFSRTAPSACSTPRWRCTMPGAIACRST